MSTRENPRQAKERLELLQGTLDLLILRTLIFAPQHGQGIARAIQQTSDEELLVEHGALYPALPASRRPRLDLRPVGNFVQQPQGPLLLAHRRRPQAARQRNHEVEAADRRNRAHS